MLLLLHCCFCSPAQNKDSIVSSYIQNLRENWSKHSGITFNEHLNTSVNSFSFIAPFYNNREAHFDPTFKKNEIQKQLNFQEQEVYRKDLGFNLVANYQRNFSAPFADPEDIVVFRQKYQAGLQWEFLRSGLLDNRLRLKQLKLREKALQFRSSENLGSTVLKNNFNMIVYLLNEEKVEILKVRKDFLQKVDAYTRQLLSLNQISKENFIKVNQHLNDIFFQLNVYERYNRLHEQLKLQKPEKAPLPVFDIDFEKITTGFITAPHTDSSAYYQMLAAQSQNYLVRDMTLNANVKYNFYDVYNSSIPNRAFLSVGMNMALPLAPNYSNKKQRDVLNAQLLSLNLPPDNGPDSMNVILNSLYEFRYKQKQYANLLQKRQLFEELVRNEEVKYQYQSVEFNPLNASLILDDFWSTVIELIDLKQDMYRILNELKLKLKDTDIASIIKPYNYEPMIIPQGNMQTQNNFKNIQAVYIWSESLKNHSASELVTWCKLNNFNTLLLTSSKETVGQVKELTGSASNFNFELLVSNNDLLNRDATEYFQNLAAEFPLSKFNALHLDIEPQAQPDFKEKKSEYFEKYLALIDKAAQFTTEKQMKLCVSIPLNYPEDVLKKIYEKCAHVYLMAYENVKPSFILEKTKEELAIGKEKNVLALRCKDFKNKAGMDQMFINLGFKNAAYHQLEELMSMNKKNIEKGGGK